MTPTAFEHFDAQAGDYADRSARGLWGAVRRREIAAVMQTLDPQPGERILDAGCGAGLYARRIQAAGAEVVGLDGAAQMVAAARAAGIDAREFDLHAGPPPGGPRDKILCAGALEFCDDPARVVANLVEGLARPGAPLVLLMPTAGPVARLYRFYHRCHGLRIRLFARRDIEGLVPEGARLASARRVAFSWIARIALA